MKWSEIFMLPMGMIMMYGIIIRPFLPEDVNYEMFAVFWTYLSCMVAFWLVQDKRWEK